MGREAEVGAFCCERGGTTSRGGEDDGRPASHSAWKNARSGILHYSCADRVKGDDDEDHDDDEDEDEQDEDEEEEEDEEAKRVERINAPRYNVPGRAGPSRCRPPIRSLWLGKE